MCTYSTFKHLILHVTLTKLNPVRAKIIYYSIRPINGNIIFIIYFTLVNNVTGFRVNSEANT